MKDSMTHLSTRVPTKLIEALDERAKERRMQTGENVNRADVVREALENMVYGRGTAESPKPSEDFGEMLLDALEVLADEAESRGLLNDPTDFGLAVFPVAIKDARTKRLLEFTSQVYGALRAV